MKTIIITISPQGKTKIETKGFAGAECQQASESVEKALGQRQSETLTAEFHSAQTASGQQRQSL